MMHLDTSSLSPETSPRDEMSLDPLLDLNQMPGCVLDNTAATCRSYLAISLRNVMCVGLHRPPQKMIITWVHRKEVLGRRFSMTTKRRMCPLQSSRPAHWQWQKRGLVPLYSRAQRPAWGGFGETPRARATRTVQSRSWRIA
jgi:hypothetical protein